MIATLFKYRGFIKASVSREFRARYQNSLLGAAWAIASPLAMVFVYTIVFSSVMKQRFAGTESPYAYSIYLCCGVLTWGLFSELVARLQNLFIDNANLIKKVRFPKCCLPVIATCSALVNFSIVFGIFFIFLVISGSFPGPVFVWFFPIILVLLAFTMSLGLTLGIMNVYFRDIGHFFSIALTFWFWLTPIVYPASVISNSYPSVLDLNPLYSIFASLQNLTVHGVAPDWASLSYPIVLCMVLTLFAGHLYKKFGAEMADEI